MEQNTVTPQALAQQALDVQSACNLSGVARSFGEVMIALRRLPDCTGSDWANRHPVARLFAEQIAHLTGAGVPSDDAGNPYSAAYAACERLAKGEVAR